MHACTRMFRIRIMCFAINIILFNICSILILHYSPVYQRRGCARERVIHKLVELRPVGSFLVDTFASHLLEGNHLPSAFHHHFSTSNNIIKHILEVETRIHDLLDEQESTTPCSGLFLTEARLFLHHDRRQNQHTNQYLARRFLTLSRKHLWEPPGHDFRKALPTIDGCEPI